MNRATRIRLRQLAVQIEETREVVSEEPNADVRRVWSHFLSDWHSRLSTWGLTPGHYREQPTEDTDDER